MKNANSLQQCNSRVARYRIQAASWGGGSEWLLWIEGELLSEDILLWNWQNVHLCRSPIEIFSIVHEISVHWYGKRVQDVMLCPLQFCWWLVFLRSLPLCGALVHAAVNVADCVTVATPSGNRCLWTVSRWTATDPSRCWSMMRKKMILHKCRCCLPGCWKLISVIRDDCHCNLFIIHLYASHCIGTRVHTTAKAADVTKLLLLNKGWLKHPHMQSTVVSPPNRDPTLILKWHDRDYTEFCNKKMSKVIK